MVWRIRSRHAKGESGGARRVDSDVAEPERLRRRLFLSGTKTSFHIHSLPENLRKTDKTLGLILTGIIVSQRPFGS